MFFEDTTFLISTEYWAINAKYIEPIFNGARGIKDKAGINDKARHSSPSTSVAIAMSVSLCSIRKNQTLCNLGIAEYSSRIVDTDVVVLDVTGSPMKCMR